MVAGEGGGGGEKEGLRQCLWGSIGLLKGWYREGSAGLVGEEA